MEKKIDLNSAGLQALERCQLLENEEGMLPSRAVPSPSVGTLLSLRDACG